MSYESSSFSRSSSSAEGDQGGRRRKVRKKRRKTMTASEMRQGVTFQTGLTGKAKLALFGVILAGIALTVVVMMAVNGSFSLRGLEGNSVSPAEESSELEAFGSDPTQEPALPAPINPNGANGGASAPVSEGLKAAPVDDISRAFEE